MQELVELLRSDAHDGGLAGDATLLVHLDGDLERGERCALADAGLEHPELALLDGEFEVHHVGVVVLEDLEDVIELLASLLETRGLGKVGDGLGVADAGDVLALCVHQEVAVALVGAVGGVAGERDAGSRGVAHVAEDHALDVDCGAEVIGDLVLLAVEDGARGVPRSKDGLLSKTQLEVRVVREHGLAVNDDLGVLHGVDVIGEDLLERDDEVLEVVGVELGVELRAALGLLGVDGILEELAIDAHDNAREHLDEAAIGVVAKAGVAGLLDEALDGVVVEAEVEDRVHHAGHGEGRAGANGDEQRVVLVAELLAHALLEVLAVGVNLVKDAVGPDVAGRRIGDAGLAGNGESRRNGKADVGHLRQVGALAAGDPLRLVDGSAGNFGHVVAVLVLSEAVHVLLRHFTPLFVQPDTPRGAHSHSGAVVQATATPHSRQTHFHVTPNSRLNRWTEIYAGERSEGGADVSLTPRADEATSLVSYSFPAGRSE